MKISSKLDLKPPFLVHSDVFNARRYISYNENENIRELHIKFLSNSFGVDNLVFPAFNYDFPKTKIFDVQNDPVQVGSLPQYLLDSQKYFRTETPVFSFLSKSANLPTTNMAPFSTGSVFDCLYQSDGTILFYGADISSCTYLHFIESQIGGVPYRYNKMFNGTIINQEKTRHATVVFHVRPLGYDFTYNWDYLVALLNNVNKIYKLGTNFFAIKARDLSEIWGTAFAENTFQCLDLQMRDPVMKKIKELGRAIHITDCEDV